MKDTSPEDLKKDLPTQSELARILMEIRIMLMRYASHFLKKTPEIEDVVQGSCIKAVESQHRIRTKSSRSSLSLCTKNLALKEIVKSANRLTENSEDLSPETIIQKSISLEDMHEARGNFSLLCRAIRNLPIECQRVFVLLKVYGFSTTEISKQLDIGIETVEAHLARGIVHCTEFMAAEESRDNEDLSTLSTGN